MSIWNLILNLTYFYAYGQDRLYAIWQRVYACHVRVSVKYDVDGEPTTNKLIKISYHLRTWKQIMTKNELEL